MAGCEGRATGADAVRAERATAERDTGYAAAGAGAGCVAGAQTVRAECATAGADAVQARCAMTRERKEERVRRLVDGPYPTVPPDVCAEAMRRGALHEHRRTVARRLVWLLVCAALVAFVVWAVVEQPWVLPPAKTTPPLDDW